MPIGYESKRGLHEGSRPSYFHATTRTRTVSISEKCRWLLAAARRNWEAVYFGLSMMAVFFSLGLAVAAYQVFPYGLLKRAGDAAQDWAENWRHNLRINPQKFLVPSRYDGQGATTLVSGKTQEGVTLVTSLFGEALGMILIDLNGQVLHRWRVPMADIWPLEKERPNDWDSEIHGALLYPNGDVVFNVEWKVLVRIDRCSRLIWKLPRRTHHSIYQDVDGDLWVSGRKPRRDALGKWPYISGPVDEETILKVSPKGQVLAEYSVLGIIYSSGYEGLLFTERRAERTKTGHPDITHINDVKILEPPLAGAFPLFREGDIMVSSWSLNTVFVIDGHSLHIKWSMTGPFLRQHDPEFLPTGKISVFDNRASDRDRKVYSRIVEVDPVTRQVNVLYQGNEANPFFSRIMGKHQWLPNGNILITEAMDGRAFEVTREGEIVWSYINRWDEDEAVEITEATRYPTSYMKLSTEQCR